MSIEYPTFKRGEVQEYFNKLPKTEQEIINDYVKYVSITSNSKNRLANVKRSLTQFSMLTGKELSKITLKDLRDYLGLLNSSNKTQSTRNEFKHTIKRFLKNHYKDWSERFNNLDDIKLKMGLNEEKVNSDTILHKEDVDKIMKAEKTLFWKTFFISLYESGLRPIELRTLTWNRIKFNVDGDISEINIYATKTSKARSVYVKEATFFLKRLKEESDSDLVFPSTRDKTKPMGKEYPAMWLKRISLRVLGRQVYPYILRHSRATELYTNADIPDKTAQKFLGHSKSMGDVYTHLSNKDVKEAMSKTIYKQREIITPEKRAELQKQIDELKITFKDFIKRVTIPKLKSLKKALTLKEYEPYKDELIEKITTEEALNKLLDESK